MYRINIDTILHACVFLIRALNHPPTVVKNIVDCLVILVNQTTIKSQVTWKEGKRLLGNIDLPKYMAQVREERVNCFIKFELKQFFKNITLNFAERYSKDVRG